MRDIFEFEKKYKNILEDIEEWAYLRIPVAHKLKNKDNLNNSTVKQKNLQNKIQTILNIFYGFKNWFGKYDYLVFSYTDQRKNINEKMFDKLLDPIIEKIGADNCLMIEQANPKRYLNTFTKNITSRELLNILQKFLSYFVKVKTNQKLNEILKKENIFLNLEKEMKKFKSGYILYNLIFKIYKPKAISIICSYCNNFIMKAANDNNIKVVELQHGIVSKKHFGYISHIKLSTIEKLYPDYFLSFGEMKVENSLLIKHIYPVGSFYLEYIKSNFQPFDKLLKIKQSYKIVIGVSMQNAQWEIKIFKNLINYFAQNNRDICFILIPRNNNIVDGFIEKENRNIIWFNKLDCYHTIMHCDIHFTLYSSCAIETPFLGVPNILYNVKNFAKEYYEDILNYENTMILDKIDNKKFRKAIECFMYKNKKEIEDSFNYIKQDYEKNIERFMKEELK